MFTPFLYIRLNFADINGVILIIVCVAFAFLIFPIYISVDLSFDYDEKRLKFRLKIYGFIKILSGHVAMIKEGFLFKLWRKKKIIYPYKKLLTVKDTVKPLKDYHIIKAEIKTEIGNENSMIFPLYFGLLSSYISNFIGTILDEKKPYVSLKNETDIYEDLSVFKVNCSLGIVLNLLMILLSLIKILTEKIINGLRKQNKFSYRNGN